MDINEYLEKKRQIQAELTESGKKVLSEYIQGLFDRRPDLKAIRWDQYTPYFNDGDSCTFSVNNPYFRLDSTKASSYICPRCGRDGNRGSFCSFDGTAFEPDPESGWEDSWSLKGDKDLVTFTKLLETSEIEDVCENVFGDHAEVTITRSESGQVLIDVSECQHD